jgi:hypothetical protein
MALVTSGGDGQGGIMTTTRRFFVSQACATERSWDNLQAHSVSAARGPAPPGD